MSTELTHPPSDPCFGEGEGESRCRLSSLHQAHAAAQLLCLQLGEFTRLHRDHDQCGRAVSSLFRMEELTKEMSKRGHETTRLDYGPKVPFGPAQPGVILGPGGDFTQNIELRQSAGRGN